MRVTSQMISGQVMFNMQRSLARVLDMQGQVSSGRRIMKPSDDPIGTLRDLNYRNELSKNEQYLKNINRAQNWSQNYESTLAELKDLITQANELAISMASDHITTESRKGSANVIESIYDQILQLGNSKLNGKYVFSGFRSETKTLSGSNDGVTFNGDNGRIDFPIESGTKMQINIAGGDLFLSQLSKIGADADWNVGVKANTLLADLNGGNGVDLATGGTFTIEDENLGTSVTIDISAATTVGDVINAINAQITPIIGNLSSSLSGAGNSILLDIDDSQPRLVSDQTKLYRMHGGNGIDMSSGRILLSDGAGIDLDIDLNNPTPATTLGDVRAAFNAQTAAYGPPINNVTMQINGAGTGLEIIDANGVPLNLIVSNANENSTTATDLGLVGNVGASLVGLDLEPQHAFKISEIGGSTAADVGLLTSFVSDEVGADLDPIITLASTATTLLSDLNNGAGFPNDELIIWQGNVSQTFDMSTITTVQDMLDMFNNSSLNMTAELNPNGSGIQLTNNDPTKSFSVEDVGTGNLSHELGLFGSSDMMGSLLLLSKALKSDNREEVALLIGNFEQATSHLLENRASVGAKMARLESTYARLIDLELNYTKLLSEVEDVDITEALTKLSAYENNYQASLMSAARIIQPSLVNFLR